MSDIDSLNSITLDQFSIDSNTTPNFIKMDIEGSEVDVIEDLLPILGNFTDIKLAVCVYHRGSDEKRIRDILKDDYLCEERNGHMLFLWEDQSEIEYPFFRHGVLRINNRRYD